MPEQPVMSSRIRKNGCFLRFHNRAFNYNSSALFQYVKEYHPEIQAFYVMEDPGERERLQERFGKESVIDTSTIEGIRKVLACKVWFTSNGTASVRCGVPEKIPDHQPVARSTVKKDRDGTGKSWTADKAVTTNT